MNRRWLGALVGCAAAVLSAREASACEAPPTMPEGCRGWELRSTAFTYSLGGALLTIPSMITTVAIVGWTGYGQGVPRAWSVTGTAVWGAHTLLGTVAIGLIAANAGNDVAALITLPLIYTIVSAASLGLSLWALANPYREATTQRALSLGVMPWVSPQSTGITLAGRF
ncbi:MAG: hypothetical protein Q8Q09_07085 [Deltaproteobacteria bacterium]|nr:hypothetical protein [Deltaproteobacteria bacterium]